MDRQFIEKQNLFELKKESIENAEIRFDELAALGVIRRDCSFDDPVWYTTDEYSNIGLHFTFDEESYGRHYREYFHLSFEDFLSYLKSYLTILFGKNALSTMQDFVLDVRHLIATDIDEVADATARLSLSTPSLVSDFLSLLPEPYHDYKDIDLALDTYCARAFDNKDINQRTLADFDSYFLFDSILKDFWKAELSDDDRLFYYPLYLWWNVTAVIPQRPREFILTERDCISRNADGSYMLRLRKNKLKGGNKSVSYNIENDYEVITLRIPENLGLEIERYIEMTEEYESTDLGTLFVSDPHYRKWGQRKHRDSRYFTYVNLRTVVRVFYQEVIEEIYGLNVYYRYEPEHLRQGDICYIQLGDTRHIALINMMQQGGTPAAAMFLAGHDNINDAAHYYSNLSALTRCKTYCKHSLLVGSSGPEYQIIPPSYFPDRGEGVVLTDGGKCYSEKYKAGDFSDCYLISGPDGELGMCTSCTYYRPIGLSYFTSDDIYKRNLMDDCIALERAVSLVRSEKGGLEDIGEAVLRLSASSESYSRFLEEREANGQKKTD
ncbi:MAG: hypothetical protein J6D57_13295 [Mogibacterium sp.]|nr:hypothetical protein [Mogibacterium sp.]